jgi:hypothetical protein
LGPQPLNRVVAVNPLGPGVAKVEILAK